MPDAGNVFRPFRNSESELRAERDRLLAEVQSLREVRARLEKEIAERDETERRLRQTEVTLRKVFDATLDSMLVIRLADLDELDPGEKASDGDGPVLPSRFAGRFVDINCGFEKEFGFTRQEVIGRKFGELNQWVDLEARARLLHEMTEHGSVHNFEAELRAKDGRIVPCLVSGAVVEVEGARYAVAIVRNISELKEAQRRLRESEETFRKIFEANLDSMIIVDLHTGRFVDVNEEFLRRTGFTREEIIGQRSREFNIWANPDDSVRFVEELRKNRQVRNMEATFRHRNGTSPCLTSATLVELRGHLCCLTMTRNIAALKEAERQLIEAREAAVAASRAKSEFLSSMSHEIRTPMNAVLGMADLLAETDLDTEQRKYLSTMINNGNALLELINDILDLAKVEAGRFELERTGFDLIELTDRVCETLAIRAHSKHLELASRVVPGIATDLIGDPLRVRQILINLIGNAIKFTEMGSVVLTVAQESDKEGSLTLHFSVADTGIGIAPDQLPKIFASFTQADSSTTRKYGGTGLGLAIVKRLVELMGGRIWVESELGKGSTFHFTARFGAQPQAQSALGKPQSPAAALDLIGVRTLVVDDISVNRVILREMLGAKGAVVSEAESGEMALAKLIFAVQAGQPYQLLVLDRRMPGMDGLEVAARLKGTAGGCRLVTLMLTSDDFSVKTARLRELGIHACLVKPIRRSELYQVIAKAMAEASGAKASAPTEQTYPPAQPQPSLGPGLRILLAEDSTDNRLLIEAYLQKAPHQLETAENGEIALSKFIAGQFDLVLMDMQMPVMDGYTAVREIRKWESENGTPRSPIIALTASALKEDARKSLEAGCDAHIPKPVKKAVVLSAIRDFGKKARGKDHNGEPGSQKPPEVAGVGFFSTGDPGTK